MEYILKFKQFLLSLTPAPSNVTVKNYVADVKHFVYWYEGFYKTSFNPQDITLVHIQTFQKERQATLSLRSLERHISSLRKFFQALKLQGITSSSPFEEAPKPKEEDLYHLKEFKDFLYVYNASHLTIKNYLIDVKQFLIWAQEVTKAKDAWNVSEKNVLHYIDDALILEYRERLLREQVFSPSSINRKLSSLRKYVSWASQNGLIQPLAIHTNPNVVLKNVSTLDNFLPEKSINKFQTISNEGSDSAVKDTQNETSSAAFSQMPLAQAPQASSYSAFPPLRLLQKISKAVEIATDALIVSPLTSATVGIHKTVWKLRGKPLFAKKLSEKLAAAPKVSFEVNVPNIKKEVFNPLAISTKHFPWHKKLLFHIRYTRPSWYRKYHSLALAHYFNWAILIIFTTAIGFGMYNSFIKKPNSSLAALPTAPLRILSFQGRLTDNNDNPITSATWLRFEIYNSSTATGSAEQWEEVRQVSPDQDGIFSVLLGSDGSGGAAASCGTFPLSSPATGACGIPSTLFSQNSALYLGVTVNNTAELTPRQQLATVAYASNSETLQGLQPITAAGAGTQNVVLALDSSGNLSIGASTQFQSTTGQFSLLGNSLLLGTNAGTNGNVTIAPDGTGKIDLQKPLTNTTLNNNIPSAAGAVEVDDAFAVLATSSGQSAVTINQNGTAPLISASASGVQKFTVANSGSITAPSFYDLDNSSYFLDPAAGTTSLTVAGAVGIGTTNPNNFKLQIAGSIGPQATNTYDLGSPTYQWNNIYANNIYQNGQPITQTWQRNLGVLAPNNITDDVAVGGTSTSSAKFQVFGIANGSIPAGTASTSGQLSFTTSSQVNLLNNAALGFYNSVGGDSGITSSTPALYISNSGKIGIGTTAPSSPLTVGSAGGNNTTGIRLSNTSGTAYTNLYFISNDGSYLNSQRTDSPNLYLGNIAFPKALNINSIGMVGIGTTAIGNGALVVNQTNTSGSGDILTASASGTTEFKVSNTGTVTARSFYDLDNTSYFLDPAAARNSLIVAGTVGIGTTSPLSQSGIDIEKNALGNATAVINQTGLGDVFTASSSGTPKFTIQNDGTLVSGKYTTAGGVFYTNSTGTFQQASNASANTVLHGGSTPSFSAVSLTADVTGNLPLSNGGTGANLTANAGGIVYSGASSLAILAPASVANECLVSGGGTAAPSWATCSSVAGGSYWSLNNGSLFTDNATLDLFVGGTSTASAKFAVLNMNSGTPTASVSATATGTGLSLVGDGTIQSLINSPLTIGGNTTGNITFSPLNGAGTISVNGVGLDTTSSTFSLLTSASTLTIGKAASTTTFGSSTIDSSQSTVTLFGTPSTVNINKTGGTTVVLGAATVDGNVTLGTNSTNTITANGLLNTDLVPTGNGSINLGSPTHYYNIVYANSFSSPVGNGTAGFWTVTNNTNLYPTNTADDLLIGGTATGSASFQIFAQSVGSITAGTASTSGNLIFNSNATIATTKFNGLSIGGTTTGNITLTPQNGNGTVYLNGSYIDDTAQTTVTLYATPTTVSFAGSSTNTNIGASTGSTTVRNNFAVNGTFQPNGQMITSLIPVNTTINLGSSSNYYGSVYANNLYMPSTGGIGGFWQLASGALAPTNISNDFLVGGAATSSAKFQIFANRVAGEPAGTASTSGQLTFTTSSQVNLLNNANLGFYNSVGGDAGITSSTPALYIANSGNIGIGTNNPSGPLDVYQSDTVTSYFRRSLVTGQNIAIRNNANGNIIEGDSSTGNGKYLILASDTNSSGISFRTNTTDGSNNTRMVLDNYSHVGIGTTSMGNAALVVNQVDLSGLGDLFTASASGTPEFTIANDGSIKNSLIPNLIGATGIDTLYNLGSSTAEWDTLYVRQIVTPSNGGIAGYWQLSSTGVLAPANITNDLAIGGIATGSATPWQVFATGTYAGTATSSGNLSFRGASTKVDLLNNATLGFYNSVGGNSGEGNPALYIASSGNIGIGTNNPGPVSAGGLEIGSGVSGGQAAIRLDNTNGSWGQATRWSDRFELSSTTAIALSAGAIGNNQFWLSTSGNVGIGTTSPVGLFQVTGAPTGKALSIFNETGDQDILTASSSGTTKFVINNNGNVAIGSGYTTAQGILDVANSSNLPSDFTLNQTSATNLLGNPSFEGNSTTGWGLAQGGTGGTMVTSTSTSMFGIYSLLITTGTAWTEGAYTLTVSPSTTYTFSAWVKTSTANNAALQIYDHGTSSGTTSSFAPGDGKWHRLTVTATTGSSTTTVDVDLFTVINGATAYYDGVQLETGSSATPYLDGSLGPGYYWTGKPNNSTSVRQAGAAFAYDTLNSAQGIGAASLSQFPTLQLDQDGTGDIMTASASGTTELKLTTGGALYARSFYDLDNSSYFLDPAASGTSLTVAGNVGIGTTSPDQLLQLSSNSTSATYLSLTNTSSSGREFLLGSTGSANGQGVGKFVIWDNTAGANRFTIDSSGNVGIGTTTPGSGVTMNGGLTINGTGTTMLTIENNGTNSFALNPGSSGNAWVMYDYAAGSFTAGIAQKRGSVGIGTTSPGDKLEVDGDVRSYGTRTRTGSGGSWGGSVVNTDWTSGGCWTLYIDTSGPWNIICPSDQRLKTNVTTYQDALSSINQLNPVTFNWIAGAGNGDTLQSGFIAQQVAKVFPYLVTHSDFTTPWTPDGTYHLNYEGLISPAIAAIQELSATQSAQTVQIATNSALLANLNLNTTGDLSLQAATPSADFSVPTYYTLNDALGNPISQMGALAELVVGNLRAGSIQAQQTITNTLAVATDNVSIAGQSLQSYIVSVVQSAINNGVLTTGGSTVLSPIAEVSELHTNLISPLASTSAIALDLSNNSRIDVENTASQQTVASIDNFGNATFSGQLNSQNLAVNGDATISGTLYANNIKANSIEGLQEVVSTLSAQNITNVTNIYFATPSGETNTTNIATGSTSTSSTTSGVLATSGMQTSNFSPSNFTNVASYSSYLAYVPNLTADTGMFNQGLVALGPTSLTDTTITGQLSIGTQLMLSNNAVNVLGADFAIQPLQQGGVTFEGGRIAINTNGDLTVNGKAIFNSSVLANVISPLSNDKNLTIQLGQNSNATGSALATSQLSVENASGSGVFSIDQLGNVIASGAATIGKLNLSLAQPALAVSDTEVIATGSAGTSQINAHQAEITIDDPLVTSNSLIYITPVGNSGVMPYLTRQTPGKSFTVGVPAALPNATTFNWLIVN